MLTRLTHAAIAFALTAVLYQAYVLAVVPFVEPAWSAERPDHAATEQEIRDGRDAVRQYGDVLAAYFPADHWSRLQPPLFFDNGQAMVVVDRYDQSNTGLLRVPHCAVIFFPRGRDRGGPPPRDAIVLEPSQGAMLQMDKKVGRGMGGFGRMQNGQLLGDVVVRSDMRRAGPEDDLVITTRDLYMNEDLIRTNDAVQMRLGEHFGRGRGLEIRFLRAQPSRGDAGGVLYGRLESLQILHEVSAVVSPGKLNLLGDNRSEPSQAPAAEPPIRIQSAGPFRIEFTHDLATFTDQVQLRQLHEGGKLDELLAEELRLYFRKGQRWNAAGAEDAPSAVNAPPPGTAEPAFELASIIAEGTPESPVRLNAPSRHASATGQRLWIELAKRKITLDKGEEVVLRHNGAEIHAPMIEYQLPASDDASRVGLMAARGSGWFRANVDPARPESVLEVRWTAAMQLVRRDGMPVLVLDGRPRIQLAGVGTLWADELQVFLREQAPGAADPSTDEASRIVPSSVVAERITADGRVAIESAGLTGKVNRLDVLIDHSGGSGGMLAARAGEPAIVPSGPAPNSNFLPENGPAQRAYDITGVVLRVNAAMRNRRPQVTAIHIDGAVDFKELPLTGPADPTLQVVAEHVQVTGADTPNAEIVIRGAATDGRPTQLAQVTARGTTIRAPELAINRGASTARINSPGEVEMLVDKDLNGQPLLQPEPLKITWQESMLLEGSRLKFNGDAYVEHASGWLRTKQLVAQLAAPVRFDGAGGTQNTQVEQLECWGGAVAEFDERDQATGEVRARQRLEVQSLQVNQRTGLISGDGPGWIDSVHVSRGSQAWLPGPAGAPAAAPFAFAAAANNADGDSQLRHLHIDFVRAVGGNLHTRTVNVQGDVKAVYGPVENWDERLSMSPGGRPGLSTVWITCDQLGVTESPAARLMKPPTRQIELEALGQVNIEGQDAKRGLFTAIGHKATYDQSKAMFILEGDGRTPATIENRQFPSAPASPQSAQKMIFWQNTGRVKIEGLQQGEINQIELNATPR